MLAVDKTARSHSESLAKRGWSVAAEQQFALALTGARRGVRPFETLEERASAEKTLREAKHIAAPAAFCPSWKAQFRELLGTDEHMPTNLAQLPSPVECKPAAQ